ncbi:DUF3566 domain-containing protein [Actinomadura sp. ATCC 31491]|uniref:DUF3566 domain-containing protein n=1 Tax=Actinomadura luzonensis TaxID=2805427 RepID=A0ABT0FPG5_9ACTN|nr:DUF3566 domain-containing protein [Actinomadura luzonensis]MCK2214242.1 DUF3566 domain-containing protein [Actinomadura luzonensis]
MSAQGGSARTKAASGNGQQPNKPAETEIFNPVDDGQDTTSPAQGKPPVPAQDDPQQRSQAPAQAPGAPSDGNNDPMRVRPSLATEAPPKVELPGGKSKKNAANNSGGGRLPRKAHLVLRRIEPWSAMKFSFVVSLVCFVVLFVAVAVLYGVLQALGVFDSIVDLVNQLGQGEQGQSSIPIDIASWFEPVRILGYTALIGAVNVVLITALSTLGAVIYNISSDLVGGVEVTFSEAE